MESTNSETRENAAALSTANVINQNPYYDSGFSWSIEERTNPNGY